MNTLLLNINNSAEVYSDPSQKSKMKRLFSFQKLARITGNCIKFSKERIKAYVAIECLK